MNKLKYLLILLIFPLTSSAQSAMTMTMKECIELASKQSLDAFLTRNMYLAQYWDYRSYKASRLPSLRLNTTPLDYYNGIAQVWDSNREVYVTKHTQSLNTSASLFVQQRVGLTGGTVSVSTGNEFLNNYTSSHTFTSSPLSVSYNQNLNGFNNLKWRAKIDPERYESAKQSYIQNRENLSISAIRYFFQLVNSQIELDISDRNLNNAEELFKIGKGRFEVGTITKDELLSLELGLYNSQLAQIRAEQDLLRARVDLNIFLNVDKATVISCIIPEEIPGVEISMDEAVTKALQNNSKLIDLHVRELQSERAVSQAKAENRFTSSLQLTYGLNGNNDQIVNSYDNLSQRQRIKLGFNIPIIDWGEGKGAIAVAKSNLEAERIKVEQEKIAFEQNVSISVLEFNLQKKQVDNSAKADTIALTGYNISYEIFKLGKLDVIRLNQARNDQVKARKAYISSLLSYWTYWYRIRQLTLYDFDRNVTLSEDFDALINP